MPTLIYSHDWMVRVYGECPLVHRDGTFRSWLRYWFWSTTVRCNRG